MGTRSTIQVNDKESNTTIIFYKHWDGYPSDNLKMFKEAFEHAENVNDFLENCSKHYGRDFNEMMEYSGPYDLNSIQNEEYCLHGDLEYHYQIDFKNKNIDVYGGYGNEIFLISKGKFNPLKEADSYVQEYKEVCKKKLMQLLNELLNQGVTVNK